MVRLGVALHAEYEIGPALTVLAARERGLVLEHSQALSEQLLAAVADGRLDAAIVHQVPALEGFEWEVVRRGRLAALVGAGSQLALRTELGLEELRDQAFLVAPHGVAPQAREGLRQMCVRFGGFEPRLVESTEVPRDGGAVMVLPAGAARAAAGDGVVAVPLRRPPVYALVLAWRGEPSPPLAAFRAALGDLSAAVGGTQEREHRRRRLRAERRP